MVKVMYNDKLVYNVYISVYIGIIFGKEKKALIMSCTVAECSLLYQLLADSS